MADFSGIVPPEPRVLDDLRAAMAYEKRQSIADKKKKRTPRCPACGQKIVWVPTSASEGEKHTMCDPEWQYGDGEKTLVTRHGEQIVEADGDVLGREPHWGTCPEKEKLKTMTATLDI